MEQQGWTLRLIRLLQITMARSTTPLRQFKVTRPEGMFKGLIKIAGQRVGMKVVYNYFLKEGNGLGKGREGHRGGC